MTVQTLPPRRKPACKLAFQVERGPHWLTVAVRGEASFDQAEVISAQLDPYAREFYANGQAFVSSVG
jgi:hypothetical protein